MLLILFLFSAGLSAYLMCTQPHQGHEHVPGITGKFLKAGVEAVESNGLLYSYFMLFTIPDTSPDWLLRLPAAICSLLTLFFVYAAGRDIGGRALGLCCAFMLAVNTSFIALAVHHRFYSTGEMFCALATWALIRACQSHSRRWWALYGLAMCAAISSMVLSAVLLIVHAPICLMYSSKRASACRRLLAVCLAVGAIFIWLNQRDPEALERVDYGNADTNLSFYTEFWLHNGSDLEHFQPEQAHELYNDAHFPIQRRGFACVIAVALLSAFLWRRERCGKFFLALILGFFLASAAFYLFSRFAHNISRSSNLAFMYPSFAMILGYAMWRCKIIRLAALGLVLYNPYAFWGTYAFANLNNDLERFVTEHMRPGDVIISENSIAISNYPNYPLRPLQHNSSTSWLGNMRNLTDVLAGYTPLPLPNYHVYTNEQLGALLPTLWRTRTIPEQRIWILLQNYRHPGPNFIDYPLDAFKGYFIALNDGRLQVLENRRLDEESDNYIFLVKFNRR